MNRLLLLINLLLKGLDVATTAYLVHRYGTVVEGNPVIRTMFNAYGITPTFVVAFAVFGLLVVVLYWKRERKFLMLSAIFMLAVVINNTVGVIGTML